MVPGTATVAANLHNRAKPRDRAANVVRVSKPRDSYRRCRYSSASATVHAVCTTGTVWLWSMESDTDSTVVVLL